MTVPASLNGTVALVTGASSGIGEATARALAAQGATVALVARRQDRLEVLAADIGAAGGTAVALPADLTAEGEAARLVGRAITRLGRLDTLANAAGIMLVGPALDAPAREWQRNVDPNVSALVSLTHAALPHLVAAARQQRGVADLVNISSVAGRQAIGGAAVYGMTKFGVTAFSEALRQELAARHVRVSAVEPGAVATELTRPRHVAVNELLVRPTEQV